jgi:hypothetical protein
VGPGAVGDATAGDGGADQGAPAEVETPWWEDPHPASTSTPASATVSPASEGISRAVRRMTNSWGAKDHTKGLNDTSDWY